MIGYKVRRETVYVVLISRRDKQGYSRDVSYETSLNGNCAVTE